MQVIRERTREIEKEMERERETEVKGRRGRVRQGDSNARIHYAKRVETFTGGACVSARVRAHGVIRPSSTAAALASRAAARDYARMLQGHICRISTRLLDLAKRLHPTRIRRCPGGTLHHRQSCLRSRRRYLPIPIGFVIAPKCSDSWR